MKANITTIQQKEKKIALKKLSDQNDVTIAKTDMGGAVVIKDVEEYVQEAEDKINIKDAYKKAST